jgi:hypothetical protein
MPGSAYTTIDHDARGQDILVDTCEDFLSSEARVAAKAAHFAELARVLVVDVKVIQMSRSICYYRFSI